MTSNPSDDSLLQASDISAEALVSTRAIAAERTARRGMFEAVIPEPRRYIVAWIDILGFKEQIRDARTTEEFQAVFRRLRMVHDEFDHASGSTEPGQEERNTQLGRRIIALSDGLVIVQNLEEDSPLSEMLSFSDQVGYFLGFIQLAHARCAASGIFLRGGISVGDFWFEHDVLLSPALVRAYEIETRLARYPVILLERSLADEVEARKTESGYEEDSDEYSRYFEECDWLVEADRENHVMLEFMSVFVDDEDPVLFLRRFIERAREARETAIVGARPKYDWLIAHARAFVASDFPDSETVIFGPNT